METINVLRTGRPWGFAMHGHWVFVTKYRRQALRAAAHETLRELFSRICEDFEARLLASNGADDHVHLLVAYPPKVAIATLVNSLKGVSSRRLRLVPPAMAQRYYQGVLWSSSYCAASCGGGPVSIIRQFVEHQRQNL